MTIRENLEQWEKDYLSPYASLSVNSKGRLRSLRNSVISGRYFNGTETVSSTARHSAD